MNQVTESELEVPPSVRSATDWLGDQISAAAESNDFPALLRFVRDRAFVLLSYFSAVDLKDLSSLQFSDLSFEQSALFISICNKRIISFTDSRFCPVTALQTWLSLSGLESGPIFRRVKSNGRLSDAALFPGDLKNIFEQSVLLSRTPELYPASMTGSDSARVIDA
jgi:hypothetical protein